MTTMSSREFNQHASAAKRAADTDPVFITDRGKPSHVLMSITAYQQLQGRGSLSDALGMPDEDDIDFAPHRTQMDAKVPDLG